MKLRFVIGAWLLVALIGALAVACGDDNGDGVDDGGVPEATEPMEDGEPEQPGDGEENGDDEPAAGDGGGTLTVGDQTWNLSIIFCGFSPEETENDRVSFTMVGSGETADGEQGNLDVTIQDTEEQGRYSGEGTIQSVTIGSWEGVTGFIGEPAWEIQVDGNNVSAEPAFDDVTTDALEEVPGTLEATCP